MKYLGDQYRNDSARMKAETHDMIRAGRLKAPTLILWAYNDPSAPLSLGLQLMNIIAPAHPQTQMHILNIHIFYVTVFILFVFFKYNFNFLISLTIA